MDEFKEIKKINENKLAVIKNDAVDAIYDMNLNQLKLFIALVTLIEKDDVEFQEYKIDVKSLMNIFNISNENDIYAISDKVTDKLADKFLKIKDKEKKEYEKYPIFGKIAYSNGILTVSFNKYMKPFLLDIKKEFTKFTPKEFKPFDSKYSIRIYQLLKEYQLIRERMFEVDELRMILNIKPDELRNFANFRKKVIEVAQKELKNTPMAFDWEVVEKKGRKITKIKFKLKKPYQKEEIFLQDEVKDLLKVTKTQATPQQLQLEQNKIQKPYQTQQQTMSSQPQEIQASAYVDENIRNQIIKLLEQLPQEKRTHTAEMLLASYLQTYNADYIKRQIEYVNTQKPNNYFAYLKKAIEKDYANSQMAELEKARQQKMIEKALQDLEAERQHSIEVAVDREKSLIYSEYLSLLDDKEKEEFLKKYLEKAKELYPNVKEDSFEMEFKVECLITEDIISKNEIYQIRLFKVRERAEKQAQAEYERSKESLYMKLQNN